MIRTIKTDEIVTAWESLTEANAAQIDTLVQQFMQEQPALGVYLVASSESAEGGAKETPVMDLMLACWRAMRKAAGRPLRSISPEEIERAEEANTKDLERLDAGSEIELQNSVQQMLQTYNQRELLGFGLEILMSGHEEDPELAPESLGLEMLWLKTILDCLDQA
jgi:hypothetical protein